MSSVKSTSNKLFLFDFSCVFICLIELIYTIFTVKIIKHEKNNFTGNCTFICNYRTC